MRLWNELSSLHGETVELLPLRENHLDTLWKAGENLDIWTYMASKINSKDQLKEEIIKAINEREKGLQYPFVVLHKERNEIVGSTRYLDISIANKSTEIGFTWYNPSIWRTKVNTECKLLLLTHAFETWDMNRVFFKTDARNIRSQEAIARLGAIKEGVLRKDRITSDGYIRDTVFYSILKEEWPEVKVNLVEKLNK